MRAGSRLIWAMAQGRERLDPGQYLGRVSELPPPTYPGDWCDVVVEDDEGAMHWTLVTIEVGRESSIFAARRHEPARLTRAEGTDGLLRSAEGEGSVADSRRSARR